MKWIELGLELFSRIWRLLLKKTNGLAKRHGGKAVNVCVVIGLGVMTRGVPAHHQPYHIDRFFWSMFIFVSCTITCLFFPSLNIVFSVFKYCISEAIAKLPRNALAQADPSPRGWWIHHLGQKSEKSDRS